MNRGDIYELKPRRGAQGHEQKEPRYGVIVQANELLALSTVFAVPSSAQARAASFRPEIEIEGRRTRLLIEQTTALDLGRLGKRCGRASWDEMAAIDDALRFVFGLS